MAHDENCACLERGPTHPDAVLERSVGCDETHGDFADVDVIRCSRCDRLWLKRLVEVEALSRSGRWRMALIDEATAARVTPESAADVINRAPWALTGGSFYGGEVRRRVGPSGARWPPP